ncbi:hypothetical protein H4R35_004742 [Dimargaris xerosporica]|nr:hypothetical protein H4R35_004742 [Dimargaris xerosporica]
MAESTLPRFKLPPIADNEDGWGPSASESISGFQDIPYAPYSKADKVGRVANWYEDTNADTYQQRGRNRHQANLYAAYGSGAGSVFLHQQAEDESAFSLVDNRSFAVKRSQGRANRGGQGGRLRLARGGFNQRGGPGGRGGGPGRGGFRGQHQSFARRRFGWRDFDRPQRIRFAMVTVGPEWELLEEFEFQRVAKLSFDMDDTPKTLATYGHVNMYSKPYDRTTIRTAKPLQRSQYVYYDVSASDDPVLQELAAQGQAQVFATDAVISMLMCTTRTVYPWDIIVNRVGNQLFLDKRSNGPLDFVTVNENALDPPVEASDKDKDNINSPSMLASEATRVNRQFAMQVVNTNQKLDMPHVNPFPDPDSQQEESLASGAYRYQAFDLSVYEGDEEELHQVDPSRQCVLVVRTQMDAALSGTSADNASYLQLRALNQFDVKAPGSGRALDWRQKLDNQRGAIVATEIKNNNCKLARWALQGLMAGVDMIKFGYVARTDPRDSKRHTLLGTQSYKPADLAQQLNVSMPNAWGIVKAVIDRCLQLPEGKYVLARDPAKAVLKLYSVPAETFEEDAIDDAETEDAAADV